MTRMNLQQLAAWAGVHVRTAQRWASRHGMPTVLVKPHDRKPERQITEIDFLMWAAPHAWIRDEVNSLEVIQKLDIYLKAKLYDMRTPLD